MTIPQWKRTSAEADSRLAWQYALLARIEDVLQQDDRVLAAVVSGSFGRGAADEFSDVDVTALVRDTALRAFVDQWEQLFDRISPTVFRRKFGSATEPICTAITPEWRRFELVIQAIGATEMRAFRSAALLFAREDVRDRLQLARDDTPGTPKRLLTLVEEFLRVLGLLDVVVGRSEFVVGTDGVTLLRRLLIDLMLLETGVTEGGGAKRLNRFLTDDQRMLLEQLPPVAPTRASVVEGHVAVARLFLPLARSVLQRHEIAYPEEFERATLAHLRRTVGGDMALLKL